MFQRKFAVLVAILTSFPTFADEDEGGAPSVGPGFAVTEATHENGFRLSAKAEQTTSIRYVKCDRAGIVTVPSSAIAKFRDDSGIYRRRAGQIKRIEPEFAKAQGGLIEARSKEIALDDEIAVEGIAWLRVTEISLFEENEEGHGH